MNPDQTRRPSPPPQQQGYLPAGWYPTAPMQETYWDGHIWTPYRRVPPESVMEPILGWLLAASGAVLVVGSFMPWASGLNGLVTQSVDRWGRRMDQRRPGSGDCCRRRRGRPEARLDLGSDRRHRSGARRRGADRVRDQ
jgi:hypothetical protein